MEGSSKRRVPDFPDRFGEYGEYIMVGENGESSEIFCFGGSYFVSCVISWGALGIFLGFAARMGHYSAHPR